MKLLPALPSQRVPAAERHGAARPHHGQPGKFRNLSAKLSSTSSGIRAVAQPQDERRRRLHQHRERLRGTGGTTLPPGATTVSSASTKSATKQQPTAVKTLGVYVQEQAGIRDRLFITGAVRTDQNSAFGSNFQQVYYPKVSLSWIASDESYFPKFSWLDQLRLRVGVRRERRAAWRDAALVTFTPSTVNCPAATPRWRGQTRRASPRTNPATPTSSRSARRNSRRVRDAAVQQPRPLRVHALEQEDDRRAHADRALAVVRGRAAQPAAEHRFDAGLGRRGAGECSAVDRRSFGWDMTFRGSHFSNKVRDLGVRTPASAISAPGQIAAVLASRRAAARAARRAKFRDQPLNSSGIAPYTYKDDNKDGIMQKAEVHVDSASRTTATLRRATSCRCRTASTSSAASCASRRCSTTRAARACSTARTTSSATPVRSPATTRRIPRRRSIVRRRPSPRRTARSSAAPNTRPSSDTSSTISSGSSAKYRRRLQLPQIGQRASALADRFDARVRRAQHPHVEHLDRHRSRSELRMSQSESQNEFQTTGLPTYFTLRLNLKY